MGDASNTVTLRTWADARDAFRHRELRQGLYDEGRALMEHVIVNLHGSDHTARRRLENRLFRRDTFFHYERDVIPRTVESMLSPRLADGSADLIPLARRVMMSLATDIAGIDRSDERADFEILYDQMFRLARASNVLHAVGDKQMVVDDGNAALAAFEERFFRPSMHRRQALLQAFEGGRIDHDALPRDVLLTLLHNQDRLELSYDVVLREVAYYPWVGSHSTSNAFVHAIHHVFDWIEERPGDRSRLVEDPFLLQRFVHESLRLHPASPVARRFAMTDLTLAGGISIPKGALVEIDLIAANRDPLLFGDRADVFDPYRVIPAESAPWGLTFGTGFHACVGMEMAGGLAPTPPDGAVPDPGASGDHLFGAITVMAQAVLQQGARRDPANPPHRDPHTVRPNWGSYPVLFEHLQPGSV